MAGGVCPRLQPKQARKILRRRSGDRRRFGSRPLSENEKYSPSPRNSPLLHPPPKAGEVRLKSSSFPRSLRFCLLAFEPLVSPATYLFFPIAVFGLQSSLELLIVTFNLQQIIIGK